MPELLHGGQAKVREAPQPPTRFRIPSDSEIASRFVLFLFRVQLILDGHLRLVQLVFIVLWQQGRAFG